MASNFGEFTGNTIGEAAAFAAGLAIAPLLEPVLQELRNTTWQQAPDKPLDAATLAQGVAEHKIDQGAAISEAALTGIAQTPFLDLVEIMRKAPGVAEGIDLIRRGQLTPQDFLTVLQRNGLEDEFVTAYQQIGVNGLQPYDHPLDPAAVALGVVRSTLPDAGLLVTNLDTSDSNVDRYPVADIDPVAEAAASGISKERLRTMVGNVGLPLAVIAAAQAEFRGILTKGAYYQAVEEGDTRVEWADPIYEYARQILTAHDYVEARLRGWYDTDAEMYAGTAKHGMSQDDTDLLYKITGRPLNQHEITTGLARGGTYNPFPGENPDPHEAAVRQSNIRPEYYELAIANRYSYPSGFQIKAEAQAGDLSQDQVQEILLEIGWSPKWASFFAEKWTAPKASTPGPVKSATTAALTRVRRAYVGGAWDSGQASTHLTTLGLSAQEITDWFKATNVERDADQAIGAATGAPNAG